MRNIYFTAVLSAIIMISSCTKETVDGSGGIMLSLSSYTFDYDGKETITVEISGTGGAGISAVADQGFIFVSEPDGNKNRFPSPRAIFGCRTRKHPFFGEARTKAYVTNRKRGADKVVRQIAPSATQ